MLFFKIILKALMLILRMLVTFIASFWQAAWWNGEDPEEYFLVLWIAGVPVFTFVLLLYFLLEPPIKDLNVHWLIILTMAVVPALLLTWINPQNLWGMVLFPATACFGIWAAFYLLGILYKRLFYKAEA